jgi:predicted transcriptional regulator
MKTISLNVPDPTYRAFQEEARRLDRPAAELIREAMDEYARNRWSQRQSLSDLRPLSLGKVLEPIEWSDDFLEEMAE